MLSVSAAFFGRGCCAGRTAPYWLSVVLLAGVCLNEGSSGDETTSGCLDSCFVIGVRFPLVDVSLDFSSCCSWFTVM